MLVITNVCMQCCVSLWANWLQLNSQLNSSGVSFCLYNFVCYIRAFTVLCVCVCVCACVCVCGSFVKLCVCVCSLCVCLFVLWRCVVCVCVLCVYERACVHLCVCIHTDVCCMHLECVCVHKNLMYTYLLWYGLWSYWIEQLTSWMRDLRRGQDNNSLAEIQSLSRNSQACYLSD